MYGRADGGIELEDHPALAGSEPPKNVEIVLSRYAGEVSYMDHHIGRLLDDLRRRGILDNALLVVTSDHGEVLSPTAEHPYNHGWTTYQADVRAVGIFRLPNAERGGTRLDLPTASIDILPTVLNYLGLPLPAGVEGEAIDLKDPGGGAMSRTRFGEATWPWDADSDSQWLNNLKARCVREGSFKYIQTQYLGREELYDLSTDPHERRNLLASLAPEMVARAAELRGKLEAWTATADPLPSYFDRDRREETLRRLRALGYVADPNDEPD
jgi:arylsulfatase A-like enzyme